MESLIFLISRLCRLPLPDIRDAMSADVAQRTSAAGRPKKMVIFIGSLAGIMYRVE